MRPGARTIGMFGLLCALGGGCRSRPGDEGRACLPGPRAACARADLSHRSLRAMDLSGANLVEASLVGADLSGAILVGANLRGADLSAAGLDDASLRNADLSQAYLSNVRAGRADFTGATLRDAIVGGTFDGARFGGANFAGALSSNCLGNAPTTVPGRPFNVKKACAIRNLEGRGITCPDGSTSPADDRTYVSCEHHMSRGDAHD